MPILRQTATAALPNCTATALLHSPEHVLVATNDGQLHLYDTPSPTSLTFRDTVPLFPGQSITAISTLSDKYVLLSAGRVSIFDATLDEQERLPFKDVTCLDVYEATSTLLTIATNKTVIVYSYLYGHLEMIAQWRLPEKITAVKTIDPQLTIVASNGTFYTIEHTDSLEGSQRPDIGTVDWKAGFTLRAQQIEILPLGDKVLLTRGSGKCIYDLKEKSVVNTPLVGTTRGTATPFVVSTTGSHIRVLDFAELNEWEEVKCGRIQVASVQDKTVTCVTKDEVVVYTINDEEEIINGIEDTTDAIKLLRQMKYEGKSKKLRELEVGLATELFNEGHYQQALTKFTDFCASPIDVIALYPPSISGMEDAQPDKPQIDERAIRLLTHFLTDTRRKLNKLINEPSHQLPYDEGTLTLDVFTGESHSVQEIQTAIDTTLFKCYTLINPGLIGSLIRVENHCDPQLVVKTLKERHSMNELIDFYFKRGMHTEALDLQLDLAKQAQTPEILVKYLHRLKGDQLELIIKYSEWLISQDEAYGLKIFVDSPYSDTFDRFKVMKHLHSRSEHLERMFLEFIIFDLHEKATLFHTRLAELYVTQLNPDPQSIEYKKLYQFLSVGRYDNKTILNHIQTLTTKDEPQILLLQTIILSRMSHHDAVLKIFVNKIHDPKSAIKYVQDHPSSQLFLTLIRLFQDQDDKDSIIHLLSTTDTTTPLFTILELVPQFKVVDLQTYILKSIRVQHKRRLLTGLQKNLLEVDRVSKASEIAKLESRKVVVDDDTLCEVCRLKIKGSVFVWTDNGVRHYGCKTPTVRKLKSMTLKEYDER